MSLLFKCDKCAQTFTPGQIFLEGKILEKRPVMLPFQKNRQVIMEQSTQQLIHLCPVCVSLFRKWLEEKEK